MKTLLLAIGCWLLAVSAHAQYGDQTVRTISTPYYSKDALVHVPSTYNASTNKYALIIQDPGVGEHTISDIQNKYIAKYFFNNSWDGTALNYNTNAVDSFVVISLSETVYDNNPVIFESIVDWAFTNYRIDINATYITGFSGGGQLTTWYPCHIKSAFPTTLFTPKYKFAAAVVFSAESNASDPLDYAVTDNVFYWGFGDSTGIDVHGTATIANMNYINGIKPGFARVTKHALGHTTSNFYSPTYTETIDGHTMNVYNFMLYHKRNAVVANSITTTTVSASSFCVTVGSGATGTVSFTTTGTIPVGNIYTVQLSSASGSFQNPTTIGTWSNTATSGTINFTIPANTAPGNAYHIRVVNQTTIGSQNANNLIVTLATNSIAPTAQQNISVNASGTTLNVSEPSQPLSRSWYYGSVPGNYNINTNISTTSFTPLFTAPGTYYVVCKSIYACGMITSNAVKIVVAVVDPSTIYVTKSGGNCGIYWGTGNPGDKLILDSSIVNNLCYATFHDLHGTPTQPITIINKGRILDSGDYKFENCSYINFTGTGTDGLYYGFVADGRVNDSSENNKGPAGITLAGKCTNIRIDHILVQNKGSLGKDANGKDLPAGYGIAIKNDILCDSSAKWPFRFDSIGVYDCKFNNISQDIVYLVSSDPYGTQRSVNCNGVIVQYRPTGASNIRFERDTFMNAGRSFQTGGADTGYNVVTNCYFYNLGYEFNSSQGGVAFGAANNTWHFYNNTIRKTWKGVYSYIFGTFDYHDNINDSAGYVSGDSIVNTTTLATTLPPGTTYAYIKNGQAHYIGLHRNNNISALNVYAFDNPNHSTVTLKIFNNPQTNCTSPYKIQLQPGDFMYAQTGSCIQNSGNVYDPYPAQIKYSTDCGSVSFPVWQLVPVQHDTTGTTTVMHIDSTVTTVTVGADTTLWRKFLGHKGLAKVVKTPGTKRIVFYDTTYSDSVYHFTTPLHDSLELTYATQQPQFGIFYFSNGTVPVAKQVDTAFYCNVSIVRSNLTRGGGAGYNVPYINSRGAKAVWVLANSSDGAAGLKHYVDSCFKMGTPYVYCLQNEPAINCTNIGNFLNDLDSTINLSHGYGVPVADGGFEKTIVFSWVHWMVRNGKSDSAAIVISAFSLDTTSGTAIMYQQRNDSLLDGLAARNIDFNNFHAYEPRDTAATALSNYVPAIVNYIKVRTGHPVITTEFGDYNHNCNLQLAFMQQWKDIGTPIIIYFDGVGNDGNAVKLQDCFKANMLLLQ